jgi:hypothetical protein
VEVLLDREHLLVGRVGAFRPRLRELLDPWIEDVLAGEAGPLPVLQGRQVVDPFELFGRGDDHAGADRVFEPGVESAVHERLAAGRIPGDVTEVARGDLFGRLRHRERVRGVEVREDREGVRLRLGVRGRCVAGRLRQDRRDRQGLAIGSGGIAAAPSFAVELIQGVHPQVLRVGRLDLEQVSDGFVVRELRMDRDERIQPRALVARGREVDERSRAEPGSRPGTRTAAAITANATGLEPRTECRDAAVLEPDHTGPHWRTRRRPSANTTASAAASRMIA